MKKLFLFTIFIFLSLKLFSFGGVFSEQKKLNVVNTKWFDIIFPDECITTAEILYENIDDIYTKIFEEYGRQPDFRMPLVITAENESFNAYYSNYPYSRIVVYDTSSIEELDVFTNTVISTVTHELTHAVSLNSTAPFIKSLQKFFGDGFSLSFWLTSRGMSEGATVSMESSNGEGRLNSEFSVQMIKQAKIEGEFPDYYDVQCTSDIYPYGDYYYFNGAFNDYLQIKYGMQKYAELWYFCTNMKAIDFASAFKKVYDSDINEEWKLFQNQIEIPEGIEPNPVKAGISKDFFVQNGNEFSRENESGRIYTNLISSKNGIAYIDDLTDTVFFVSKQDLLKTKVVPVKLFSLRNIDKISFSNDGRFLTADYFSISKSNIKKAVLIYDMESKSTFIAKKEGAEEGTIIENNGEYYFVCKNFKSQESNLEIAKIEFSKNGKKIQKIDFEKSKKIYFPYGEKVYSLVSLKNGDFAFVYKKELNFYLCQSNLEGKIQKMYDFPSNDYVIRYLSQSQDNPDVLLFTWVKKDSMPRMGKFELLSETASFQKRDISGGVYYPVSFEDKIYYIGQFYKQPKVLILQNHENFELIKLKETVKGSSIKNQIENFQTQRIDLLEQNKKITNLPLEKYNPFDYYKKGICYPFSFITSESHGKKGGINSLLPVGLTYISTNPWEDNEITASIGYGPETCSVGINFKISGGTETNLFNYQTEIQTEFDTEGFKQAKAEETITSFIPVGLFSSLSFGAFGKVWYGRSNYEDLSKGFFGHLNATFSSYDFYSEESVYIKFSNIKLSGPGRNSYSGFSFKTSLVNMDSFNVTGQNWKKKATEIAFSSKIYIPQLIPIECKRGLVYNFPSRIELNLFTQGSGTGVSNFFTDYLYSFSCFYEPMFNLTSAKAEIILFGNEIQSAIPAKSFLWIYLHDFHISFLYAGGFNRPSKDAQYFSITKIPSYIEAINNRTIEYEQYFGIRFLLGLSFNFGLGSKTSLCFDIYPVTPNKKVLMALSLDAQF